MSLENEAIGSLLLTAAADAEARSHRGEQIVTAAGTMLAVLVVAAVAVLWGMG